jgi:hypothetical protein
MSQINQVYILHSYLFEIYFIIFFPSSVRSFKRSVSCTLSQNLSKLQPWVINRITFVPIALIQLHSHPPTHTHTHTHTHKYTYVYAYTQRQLPTASKYVGHFCCVYVGIVIWNLRLVYGFGYLNFQDLVTLGQIKCKYHVKFKYINQF